MLDSGHNRVANTHRTLLADPHLADEHPPPGAHHRVHLPRRVDDECQCDGDRREATAAHWRELGTGRTRRGWHLRVRPKHACAQVAPRVARRERAITIADGVVCLVSTSAEKLAVTLAILCDILPARCRDRCSICCAGTRSRQNRTTPTLPAHCRIRALTHTAELDAQRRTQHSQSTTASQATRTLACGWTGSRSWARGTSRSRECGRLPSLEG